jgi:hypothetical protein
MILGSMATVLVGHIRRRSLRNKQAPPRRM